MAEVILGIGGNAGDRLTNLVLASGLLNERLGRITSSSPIIESEPWGFQSDNWFLNQILVVETDVEPSELLGLCLDIEAFLGRHRTKTYSDRIMDIDILFYDDVVLSEEGLKIPHPRLHERLFILKPLNFIRPKLVHPLLGLTVQELLEFCEDNSETKWFNENYSRPLLP